MIYWMHFSGNCQRNSKQMKWIYHKTIWKNCSTNLFRSICRFQGFIWMDLKRDWYPLSHRMDSCVLFFFYLKRIEGCPENAITNGRTAYDFFHATKSFIELHGVGITICNPHYASIQCNWFLKWNKWKCIYENVFTRCCCASLCLCLLLCVCSYVRLCMYQLRSRLFMYFKVVLQIKHTAKW